ncbi:MAG: nucleotidyltransferase domain-containing protein [Spirochaetales bacterium]|nr:nucleotidyltransferase domain-containing protein [Spirochaetales bacterium]
MISDDETLIRIVEKLVQVYSPKQVYLFGSLAWGTPEEDSDIDLCIILKDSLESRADRIRRGLRALRGEKVAVDLLVLTEAEVAERRNHPSTLIYQVLLEGKMLYAAA